MNNENRLYYAYSDYLKEKHGEKTYKLPVNLPLTCPNRLHGKRGCSFCAECGTGFESMDNHISVSDQLSRTKKHIEEKYKAHKFIAYFQNYTNTFLPIDLFESYLIEAAEVSDIVEISISTRPDCISKDYLDVLKKIEEKYKIAITVELGLQTANPHTLVSIERGHTLAEFIDAVLTISPYGFEICTHVILNLPGDTIADCIETAKIISALKIPVVKIHSLYIAKNTRLCEAYQNGTITLCSKEEYIHRLISFLEYLNPEIVVERLFSRVPEKDAVFSNWGSSWWKLRDEVIEKMRSENHYQGKNYNYLGGSALKLL